MCLVHFKTLTISSSIHPSKPFDKIASLMFKTKSIYFPRTTEFSLAVCHVFNLKFLSPFLHLAIQLQNVSAHQRTINFSTTFKLHLTSKTVMETMKNAEISFLQRKISTSSYPGRKTQCTIC